MGTGLCSHPDETDPAAEGGGARFETRACNTAHCLSNIACNSKLDVVLVLDGSGSVGYSGWAATKRFAKNMVDRMYLDYEDGVQAGVVLFSWRVEIVRAMSSDRAELDAAIDGMNFPRSMTNTGEAIRTGMNIMAQGGRENVPGVVFIVTDGRPTYEWDAYAAADEARRQGTRLFFVGVGRNMDFEAMQVWASAPSNQNIATVDNYADIDAKIASLTADLCPVLMCRESFEAADESDYIGCQTETVEQVTCQYWTSQVPHTHSYVPSSSGWQGPLYPELGDFNFCRNPKPRGSGSPDAGGIWCYTSDAAQRWDYCDPRNVTTVPTLAQV